MATYAYVQDKDVSDRIARAERLSGEGSHTEAIELLEETRRSWLVSSFGVKEAEIVYELHDARVRKHHQDIYVRSVDKMVATEWNDAITLLQEIPDGSFYHDKALRKIEESKRGLVEEELDAERASRREAEQVAAQQEEARQRAEQVAATEEVARKEAERVAAREEEARKAAEQVAQQEEQARKEAEQTAAREEEARKVAEQRAMVEAVKRAEEEAARKEAEQMATQERLEKELQQRQAEKARVLELAKTHPMIMAAVSGELKFYIEPLPYYAGTGVSSAVESAARDFSSWTPYGATIRRVYNRNEADLTIAWVKDYGSHTIGESIVRIHIKVGLGTNNCAGDWSAFDADTVEKILWHELGHSVGYRHSNDPNNVMYYQIATRFVVEQQVSQVISGGWSYTLPMCKAGAYSYSFEIDNQFGGFDLFVIPRGVDPKIFSGEYGSYYIGCGKEDMVRYSGSCNVASGAQIYILNNSPSSAIRLEGEIVNTTRPPWPNMNWDGSAFHYDTAELTGYMELFR